jgi:hypothetical protein
MADLVHEVFAVGLSLITTQRPIAPVAGYPAYDRYIDIINRLLGEWVHPWVAMASLRAASTVSMQTPALGLALNAGLESFDPTEIPVIDRPNHRLAALLNLPYAAAVQAEAAEAQRRHGSASWWRGTKSILLPPESMDGEPGELSQALHRGLFAVAAEMLESVGASVVEGGGHHEDFLLLTRQAVEIEPDRLPRIGAFVESRGLELLHGGALDSQTITLPAAPRRAALLPYGEVSGMSGEGDARHGFVWVSEVSHVRNAYELEGIPLPDGPVIATLRSTVYDDGARVAVLLVVVDFDVLSDSEAPIYVSVTSGAAAAAPEIAADWMRRCDPTRLSLVLNTPATAALRRWCSEDGAKFRTETRRVGNGEAELWVIAGRVESGGGRSSLVVIPTTEFGARWFESATAEDPTLRGAVVVDEHFYEEESMHMDVVLTHLLLEEPVVGTGSWRP